MDQDTLAWERQRQEVQTILDANLAPMVKVQKLVHAGYDEDAAERLVEKHGFGQYAPVYYERLDFGEDDYDE